MPTDTVAKEVGIQSSEDLEMDILGSLDIVRKDSHFRDPRAICNFLDMTYSGVEGQATREGHHLVSPQ